MTELFDGITPSEETRWFLAADTVARVDGDELIVPLPNIGTPGDAKAVAEKLRAVLAQHYLLTEHILETSSSIGVSLFPEDGGAAIILSKNADNAIYGAKQAGRNRVQFCCGETASDTPGNAI